MLLICFKYPYMHGPPDKTTILDLIIWEKSFFIILTFLLQSKCEYRTVLLVVQNIVCYRLKHLKFVSRIFAQFSAVCSSIPVHSIVKVSVILLSHPVAVLLVAKIIRRYQNCIPF